MADGVPKTDRAQQGGWTRLAVMPFSALLPQLGDLSVLSSSTDAFRARVEEIRSGEMETEADVKKRLGEEAMLTQALQWLRADESGEE